MEKKAQREEHEKRQAQRVLVYVEDRSTPANRPRSSWIRAMPARVLGDPFLPRAILSLRSSGFRRALLYENGRKEDEHRHLEELRFPILEYGLAEMPLQQVLAITRFWLPVIPLLTVVAVMAGKRLSGEREEEE